MPSIDTHSPLTKHRTCLHSTSESLKVGRPTLAVSLSRSACARVPMRRTNSDTYEHTHARTRVIARPLFDRSFSGWAPRRMHHRQQMRLQLHYDVKHLSKCKQARLSTFKVAPVAFARIEQRSTRDGIVVNHAILPPGFSYPSRAFVIPRLPGISAFVGTHQTHNY